MYERAFEQYTCTALSITRQRELDKKKKKNKHYTVYTCMCSAESGGNASSCLPGEVSLITLKAFSDGS